MEPVLPTRVCFRWISLHVFDSRKGPPQPSRVDTNRAHHAPVVNFIHWVILFFS